jgi:hypothetical protein
MTVPGPTEIREAISALEARRVELEALIAEDLERRFLTDTEEISDVVTNRVESTVDDSTDSRTGNTRCSSQFTMTWFAVSTS